jgi:hypothetical protein
VAKKTKPVDLTEADLDKFRLRYRCYKCEKYAYFTLRQMAHTLTDGTLKYGEELDSYVWCPHCFCMTLRRDLVQKKENA